MTSISGTFIRSAIAYSSQSSSGTQVIVTWRSFTLGSYSGGIQSVTINTELAVNAQGGSSGGEESQNRSVNIWLNGVQVATNADAFGTTTYTCSGRLSTIRMSLYAEGRSNIASGPTKTPWAAASFSDYTITLQDINVGTDFIFVTPVGGKFVQLPPVASNVGKLYYFKLISAIASSDLGNNQFANQSIWVNTYNGDSQIVDVSAPAIYIDQNFGCLTLVSDGTRWYVANYYPSYRQGALPTADPTGITGNNNGNAVMNAINNFSTDGVTGRGSTNNAVTLPSLSGTPGICVVIYSGNSSASRGAGNVLICRHLVVNQIDRNPSYTATNQPYILCNESTKNTGVVFISDGTYWYIAGWFDGNNWVDNTSSSSNGGFWSMGSANYSVDIVSTTIHPTTPLNVYFTLPTSIIDNPGYFHIVKIPTSVETGNKVRFNTYMNGQTNTNFINDQQQEIYYQQKQTNSCLWIVGIKVGTIMRYYPIIGYTPVPD